MVNKANLRDLIAATSPVILLKIGFKLLIFYLEIWWMTSKNNRAPLPYYIKLCASFQSHRWIQTGVTVRKRSIWTDRWTEVFLELLSRLKMNQNIFFAIPQINHWFKWSWMYCKNILYSLQTNQACICHSSWHNSASLTCPLLHKTACPSLNKMCMQRLKTLYCSNIHKFLRMITPDWPQIQQARWYQLVSMSVGQFPWKISSSLCLDFLWVPSQQ